MRIELMRVMSSQSGTTLPVDAVGRTAIQANQAQFAMQSASSSKVHSGMADALLAAERRIQSIYGRANQIRSLEIKQLTGQVTQAVRQATTGVTKVLAALMAPVGQGIPLSHLGNFIDRFA